MALKGTAVYELFSHGGICTSEQIERKEKVCAGAAKFLYTQSDDLNLEIMESPNCDIAKTGLPRFQQLHLTQFEYFAVKHRNRRDQYHSDYIKTDVTSTASMLTKPYA